MHKGLQAMIDVTQSPAGYDQELNILSKIAHKQLALKTRELDAKLFHQLWQESVKQAEFEILKRLIASVLFEKLIQFRAVDPMDVEDLILDSLPFRPQVIYQLEGSLKCIYIPIKSQTHFARIKYFDFVLVKNSAGCIDKLHNPLIFYDLILSAIQRYKTTPDKVKHTRESIFNSLMNLACGICYKLIKKALAESTEKKEKRSINELIYFEQLVTTGHPIHPLTKYRSNFSIKESIWIAPEFENRIKIGFVAVRKEFFHSDCLDPEDFQSWLDSRLRSNLIRKLQQTADPDNYAFIPVHQWQYHNWLTRIFGRDIELKRIIPLGEDHIVADPSLSLRTLYVVSPEKEYFLKLPVNLQTTSYIRTVSPNATRNGVALARVCRAVGQRHPVLSKKACFLLETEGAYFSVKPVEEMTSEDIAVSKHLAYIVRQSPYSKLSSDEVPIVTVALVDNNRLTDKPLIHSLIQTYTRALGERDLPKGALSWLNAFLDISLEGLLTLLSGYGIGFEAHMQNTITVVSRATATPTRLLLRDFGGIRINMGRLRKRGYSTEFFPMSVTIKESMEEVTNKLYYAFFQSVLGELVSELASEYRIGEMTLWKLVYQKTKQVFQRLKSTHPYPEWIDADFEKFVEKEWKFKSLLSMSLIDSDTDYVYTDTQNPFHFIHYPSDF
jgi:siderophore synthetase component